MGSKVIYLAVRVEITIPKKGEISDEDVANVISNVDYEFKNFGDVTLDTEIRGQVDFNVIH